MKKLLIIDDEEGILDEVREFFVEEVFINILFNAYHAVPGESGKISIAADLHDSRVKIKIEDNGTGMPAAQLKKLFKPFHLTKEGQGVGLGLYLTKEIIERCGGRISAKSKQSQGTSFEIELAAQQKSRVDGPGIMFNTSSKLPIINDEL